MKIKTDNSSSHIIKINKNITIKEFDSSFKQKQYVLKDGSQYYKLTNNLVVLIKLINNKKTIKQTAIEYSKCIKKEVTSKE